MNTLADIEKQYRIQDGRIISPGKFKGERAYMPLAYEALLNGVCDELANGILRISVDDKLRKEFPSLKSKRYIRFYERHDGFVCEV